MRGLRIAGVIAVAFLLGACGSDDSGGSDSSGTNGDNGGGTTQTVEVTASDFKFDPTSLSVDPGAEVEVTLTNDGDTAHTFTVSDMDLEIKADPGASATGTFTAPDSGTLDWVCSFHSQMTGTITIGDSAGGGGGGEAPGDDKGEMGGY